MNLPEISKIEEALQECDKLLSKALNHPVYHTPIQVEQNIENVGLGHGKLTTTIYTNFYATEIRQFKDQKARL